MACRRTVLFGSNSRSTSTTTATTGRFPLCSSSSSIRSCPSLSLHFNGFDCRKISQMTYLPLVRKLEKEGFESKHGEAITDDVTQVLSNSLEIVAHLYASNGQIQKIQMAIEADMSKFKSQVYSFQFSCLGSIGLFSLLVISNTTGGDKNLNLDIRTFSRMAMEYLELVFRLVINLSSAVLASKLRMTVECLHTTVKVSFHSHQLFIYSITIIHV
ncbi:hypothetical protein MKW92_024392 [Papaver armeniacum]|nr:hypothetical protein MKW92_024392 [Papaver armeniacum]